MHIVHSSAAPLHPAAASRRWLLFMLAGLAAMVPRGVAQQLSVADVVANENAGTAQVAVSFSVAAGGAVQVVWSTANGSDTAPFVASAVMIWQRYFKVVSQSPATGAWRAVLDLTAGEANLCP